MENEQRKLEAEVLRIDVFESYLYTKYVVCYWGRLSQRYHVKEMLMKAFLAVSTIVVAAGLIFGGQIPKAWKMVSGISAVTAIIHLLINWQKSMSDAKGLGSALIPIVSEYKMLWSDVQSELSLDVLKPRYKQLMEKVDLIESQYPEKFLKFKKKLMIACQDQVEASMGN